MKFSGLFTRNILSLFVLLCFCFGFMNVTHSFDKDLCTSTEDLFIERSIEGVFLPDETELWSNYIFADIELPDSAEGRVMQSMTIDPVSCKMYIAVSMQGTPEILGLWSFNSRANYSSFSEVFTQLFGHGQDMSREVDGRGEAWIWLGDRHGNGAYRFRLQEKGEQLIIRQRQHVRLLAENTAPKSQLISVSADGRYVASTARSKADNRQPVMVRVYEMTEIRRHLDRDTIAQPAFEWPLAEEQQKRKVPKQGMAILGNSVFILSGNNQPKTAKWIYTYNIQGVLLAKHEIGLGYHASRNRDEFGIYEPEGLEIITRNGENYLIVGISTGIKHNRINRLYSLKLKSNKLKE